MLGFGAISEFAISEYTEISSWNTAGCPYRPPDPDDADASGLLESEAASSFSLIVEASDYTPPAEDTCQ